MNEEWEEMGCLSKAFTILFGGVVAIVAILVALKVTAIVLRFILSVF